MNTKENTTVPKCRLVELRKRAGFSQGTLSKASGIHVMLISKLERGERKMDQVSLKTALALADALGVIDLRELLPERKQAEDQEQKE